MAKAKFEISKVDANTFKKSYDIPNLNDAERKMLSNFRKSVRAR